MEIPVYKALGDLFVKEGVDTVFALLGDANMHWAIDIAKDHGVRIVHARHENSACAMADGYARTTGRIGVATTTAPTAPRSIASGRRRSTTPIPSSDGRTLPPSPAPSASRR